VNQIQLWQIHEEPSAFVSNSRRVQRLRPGLPGLSGHEAPGLRGSRQRMQNANWLLYRICMKSQKKEFFPLPSKKT
jgi:hypothetical protein